MDTAVRVLATWLLLLAAVARAADDPRLASWLTAPASRYARLYENDAAKNAGTAVATWSRGAGAQSSPVYAGVAQISYSANWVYLRTSGLGLHTMGPWYLDAAHTQNFPNFPANTATIYRVPRTPTVPTTKTLTGLGAIGYVVDGVALFDNRDSFSYSNAGGRDADPMNGLTGDGIWSRDAYVNEGVTFDPASAHQAGAQYHYHANPPALRQRLGDHVNYNAATKTYSESTAAPTAHSPILGWVRDGHPIYGPYGYASALDATSGVRRMISGYVKRDGASGTTNLAATGRTTLPAWAARAQGRSATLAANQYGPAVNATYVLGRYLEDYDYLGDLGRTIGTDFDLDACNGRFCVTPEFPGGTYAYFVSIESDGAPKFPYNLGRWFHGDPTGAAVTSITETVTTFSTGGPAASLAVTAVRNGSAVTITWTSVEGATYRVETSSHNSAWTTVAAAVTSAGATTTFNATSGATYFRVTLTAMATYDTRGVVGTPVGTSGTAAVASSVSVTATQAVVGTGYLAGGNAALTHTFTASEATLTRVAWQLLLPAGWTFASSDATGTASAPAAGTADLAEWVWTSVPASPFTFRAVLNVPASASGSVSISAIVNATRADGATFQVLVQPEPLTATPAPAFHSADSNKDGRLSLLELTRVIELYNTRTGTSRTGRYRVEPTSEDGFAPAP